MSFISIQIRACVVSSLTVGCALTLVACGGELRHQDGSVGESSQAVCAGNNFYGSDSMKNVVISALSAQGISATLFYPGSGSGTGESSMRGTYATCSGTLGTVRQLSAPMSRDLNGACTIAGTSDSLQSKRVGLDGILALTARTNTETNISTAQLAKAFCSAPVPPGGTCASSLVINGRTYTRFYRRDDASGTTDTLKAVLGCTALCNDVAHQVVTETFRPSPPCSGSDSDTECLGKLVANNSGATAGTFALGYAGRSERVITNPALELTVNGVAPTDPNLRNLSYPLSRFLYVNYNKTMLKRTTVAPPSGTNPTPSEKKFLCENILGNDPVLGCPLGGVDRTSAFETLLGNNDFLKCSATTGPFACQLIGASALACP